MKPLSSAQIHRFRQQGYLVVSGVYEPAHLLAARERFQEMFSASPRASDLLLDPYQAYPELAALVFNERYAAVLHQLVGPDAVLIPECAIHRDRFIRWHADTTEQEITGIVSHRDLSTPMLQVATYFQENGPSGGGITALPGTHRAADPFCTYYSKRLGWRVFNKVLKWLGRSLFHRLDRHPQRTDVLHQLGDLVIFDLRLHHRATFPMPHAPRVTKFAVFNTCTLPTAAGMDYYHFMKKRPEPYYRFFREKPLPPAVQQVAERLHLRLLY